MRSWIAALIVGSLGLSLLSCHKSESPKEYSKTMVVLVDYSESARNARQGYMDSFKKVTSQIKTGDHIFVWKITELSEMESKPIIDEHFPFPPPAKNEFYRKQAIAKAEKDMRVRLEEIEKMMHALLDSEEQLSKRTAILGSLQVAERVFKTEKKNKAVLIIVSDMIEDSSEYNFEREKLSNRRITEIIALERNKRRLPDLNGVEGYVVGVKASDREKYYNIQNFWLRYFKECGAHLSKENYGSVLLNFNE